MDQRRTTQRALFSAAFDAAFVYSGRRRRAGVASRHTTAARHLVAAFEANHAEQCAAA